jgi:hypothetical protein
MNRIVPLAAVLSIGLLMPQNAVAQIWSTTTCAGSTLQSCVDFSLSSAVVDGVTTYYFSTTYASSLADDTGVVRATGLYDLNGAPTFTLSNITLVSPDSWTIGDEHCALAGDGLGANVFEACADADAPAPYNGLSVGQTVVFSFTSNIAITEDHFTAPGGLGARAHIISFGVEDCSFKLDSRTGQVSGPEEFGNDIDRCGTPTTVPEPMSLLLLGSGLAGVGMIARRRRNFHVENA